MQTSGASMSRLVLDLSSNDIGKTDPACLKAAGVDGVVIGVFSRGNPPHDMANLGDLCMSAGLPVLGTYGLPYFGDPDAVLRDAKWACEIAPQFKVNQVWMDVETDACDNGWSAPRPTPGQRISELMGVKRYIQGAGLTPGVYSFKYFWQSQMAATTVFSDLDFWLAAYGVDSMPTDPIETVNFGGWTTLAAHQFTSIWGKATGNTCGREERDANYWYKELEDDMTDQEREDLKNLVAIMGGSAKLKDNADRGNDFILGYTLEQQKLADHIVDKAAHQ